MIDNRRGYYLKYIISKSDGSEVDSEADYFVLRLDTDEAARSAILKYADEIESKNPILASDIRNKVAQYCK